MTTTKQQLKDHHIVLAHAGTHRTVAMCHRSMGPRLREDDVGLGLLGIVLRDFYFTPSINHTLAAVIAALPQVVRQRVLTADSPINATMASEANTIKPI